jgi:hypothetical protein
VTDAELTQMRSDVDRLLVAVFPPPPIVPPPPPSPFVNSDPTTKGGWLATYGATGYAMFGNSPIVALPDGITVSSPNRSTWTWAASSNDYRAMQIPGGVNRTAGCWYNPASFDLVVNAGQTAQPVSLYCLDWDSNARNQRIDVIDASGTVIDSQTVTGFHEGRWLTWNLAGAVTFRITCLTGVNAVVSAVCFGGAGSPPLPPPPPPPPPPMVIQIPTAPGGFHITLRCSGMDAAKLAIFTQAATWWASAITAELSEATLPDGAKTKGTILDCKLMAVDGPGGILGQGIALYYRTDSSGLPYQGAMTFDVADNLTVPIIIHEMGHALGFGVGWSRKNLVNNTNPADPRFTGPKATAEYNRVFGKSESGVPIEASGGMGTALVHWRESVFGGELFTGWLSGSEAKSSITLASMADMGYTVNMGAADAWQPGQLVVGGKRHRCQHGMIHKG